MNTKTLLKMYDEFGWRELEAERFLLAEIFENMRARIDSDARFRPGKTESKRMEECRQIAIKLRGTKP
jgi:hypothetical protein